MEHILDYIQGINLQVAAGADVKIQTEYGWKPLTQGLRAVTLSENPGCMKVWFLHKGRDRQETFTFQAEIRSAFLDQPNEVRVLLKKSKED